jgi:lipoprotein NlpI
LARHRFIDRIALRTLAVAALALALAACSSDKKDHPDTPYEVTLAAAAMEGRDYDQAVKLWTNALALQTLTAEQRARALLGRAVCYRDAGKPDPAMADLTAAIAVKPDLPEAFLLRGALYLERIDYGHAAEDFDAAIRLKPNAPEMRGARADVLLAQGQYAQAIPDLDLAIGAKPYAAPLYVLRGHAYLALGNVDRAMQDLDEAVRREPRDAVVYRARWLADYKLGRLPQAAADVQQAIALRPQDAYPVIWQHLTVQRMKAGDRPKLPPNDANVDLSKWPGQVLSLYSGSLGPDQVLAAAASAEAASPKAQKCEADFYVGAYLIAGKKSDEGRRLLSAARETCPKGFYEYTLAGVALGS